MVNQKQQPVRGLSCLVHRDEDTGVFIGHCLNYDVMEVGKTDEEAWLNLKCVVKHHIEYCVSNYPDGLKRQADEKRWDEFYRALKANPNGVRVDTIELELSPPSMPESDRSLWIQGAGFYGRECRTAGATPAVV
jgi:hypothetical protein